MSTLCNDETLKYKDFKLVAEADSKKAFAIPELKNTFFAMAFSPCGNYIATVDDDVTVKIRYIKNLNFYISLCGHQEQINTVVFSDCGKYIATGSDDETIRIWKVENGKNIKTFVGHNASIIFISFTYEMAYLISHSCDNTTKLWHIESGREVETKQSIGDVGYWETPTSICFMSAMVIYFNITNFQPNPIEPNYYISNLHCNNFQIDGGKTFSSNSKYIAVISDTGCSIVLKYIKDAKIKYELCGENQEILSVIFSPCNRYIASSGFNEKETKIIDGAVASCRNNCFVIKIWDIESGIKLEQMVVQDFVEVMSFSNNGNTLAMIMKNGNLRLWDISNILKNLNSYLEPEYYYVNIK